MAHTAIHNFDVYQSGNPKASAYYKCVENYFEELERIWDYMYASRLGKLGTQNHPPHEKKSFPLYFSCPCSDASDTLPFL